MVPPGSLGMDLTKIKKKRSVDFIFLVSRQVASKAQSCTLRHLFSHLPPLSALQRPEARRKTMSTLKCESSRRQAAGELKQEGVNKQRPECQRNRLSVRPTPAAASFVPRSPTPSTSSTPTHHHGAPPSRGGEAIKICGAYAPSERPFHFAFAVMCCNARFSA